MPGSRLVRLHYHTILQGERGTIRHSLFAPEAVPIYLKHYISASNRSKRSREEDSDAESSGCGECTCSIVEQLTAVSLFIIIIFVNPSNTQICSLHF